jgi:Family of unknown function (DUF5906)
MATEPDEDGEVSEAPAKADSPAFLDGVDLGGAHRIKGFLESRGYRRLLDTPRRASSYITVQIEGNVVREVDGDHARQMMLEEAQTSDVPHKTLDKIVTWTEFSKVEGLLPAMSQDGNVPGCQAFLALRDLGGEARFVFRNGIVVVTAAGMNLVAHNPSLGVVWEHDVIDRDANPQASRRKGLFEQFCERAFRVRVRTGSADWRDDFELTPEQEQHYRAFRACLGYLLHTYKDRANARAVLFLDLDSDDNHAMGGTGKSLTLEACGHLRELVAQDAQKYQQNKQGGGRFQFANVTSDTKIVLLNDAKKVFDFQELFNMLTGDMQIERKGENKWNIPFGRAPKLCISTNYVMPPEGVSFTRRRYIVAFGSYWAECSRQGEQVTDAKHLGKHLFESPAFDAADWQDFDNYMFDNVQLYLRDGVKEGPLDAIRAREQIQKWGDEFIEWAEGYFDGYAARRIQSDKGERIDSLLEDFKHRYPSATTPADATDFAQALLETGRERGYDFNAHNAAKGASASQRRWRQMVNGKQLNHVIFTPLKSLPPQQRKSAKPASLPLGDDAPKKTAPEPT